MCFILLTVEKKSVSHSLLNKNNFKLVFESDKFIFTKSDVYLKEVSMWLLQNKCNNHCNQEWDYQQQ